MTNRKLPPPQVNVRSTMVDDIELAITAGLRRLWKHRDSLTYDDSERYAAEIMIYVEEALDARFKWPD